MSEAFVLELDSLDAAAVLVMAADRETTPERFLKALIREEAIRFIGSQPVPYRQRVSEVPWNETKAHQIILKHSSAMRLDHVAKRGYRSYQGADSIEYLKEIVQGTHVVRNIGAKLKGELHQMLVKEGHYNTELSEEDDDEHRN